MAIKYEMLRTFVAVAKAGELQQAANNLARTPSAVSMSLKQLGEELGTPLFETDRKAKLTRAGEAVLAEAERTVRSFEHSLVAIRHAAQSDSGFLRIAAVPSIATTLLPIAVREILTINPGLCLEIRDLDSRSIVRELLEERIDLGIATSGNARHGIEIEHLFEDRFEAVLPVSHRLSVRQSVSLDELRSETFIANSLLDLIDGPEMRELIGRSNLSVHSTSSLLAMVRQGVGVSILPNTVARQSGGGVCFVPLNGAQFTRRTELMTLAKLRPSPPILDFIAMLKRTVGTMPIE